MKKPIFLATTFTAMLLFACSNDEGGDEKFSYCIINNEQICLDGPFTSKDCNSSGGKPSNSCPYGGGSSSSGYGSSYITDSRDGKTYKSVKIGNQTWMAENLNYQASRSSECYDDDPEWCYLLGRLYDWATAMDIPSFCNSSACPGQIQTKHRGICPSGWHIPSDTEWMTLINFVQDDNVCSNCAGYHLKSNFGWHNDGNGVDTYDFFAYPGGAGNPDGSYLNITYMSYYWTATENGSDRAYDWIITYETGGAGHAAANKSVLSYVRCVKD